LFVVVLVGIPGAAGAYIVSRDVLRADISIGKCLVVYAILLGWCFAYFMPEGRLTGSDYLLKMPVVLTVSIIAGLIAGFMKRRRT
jgi:ribose/xylose/arabinose/galactoside ABC-type transport system permease subunit